MSEAMPMLSRHGAAWASDRLYRLSWLAGPQAIAVALIIWMNDGTAAPPEPPAVAGWAHHADDKGSTDALAALRVRARTDPAAEHLLRQRADAGDRVAQFFMGTLLDPTIDRERATPERTREAVTWYRRSAEQGAASAMANLGLLLSRDNLGLDPDYSEAFKWLDRAAPQAPAAQRHLALLYRSGRGVAADKAKAAELMRSASDRGDPVAERLQAEALDHGADGLTADPHEAVLLYQKAALQNDVPAERELGAHLQSGRGVPADREKALFWFRKAAASGDTVAKAQVAAADAAGPTSAAAIVPPQPFSPSPPIAAPAPAATGQTQAAVSSPASATSGSAASRQAAPPNETAAQPSRGECRVKDAHGGGQGDVLGFLSAQQAAALLAETQARLGALINPEHVHDQRAVLAVTTPEGRKRVVVLVPTGLIVKQGDHVAFTAAHRDRTMPCGYIPNLIDERSSGR